MSIYIVAWRKSFTLNVVIPIAVAPKISRLVRSCSPEKNQYRVVQEVWVEIVIVERERLIIREEYVSTTVMVNVFCHQVKIAGRSREQRLMLKSMLIRTKLGCDVYTKRDDFHPAPECFEDMMLMLVFKSTKHVVKVQRSWKL
jgi:hypothetical protein